MEIVPVQILNDEKEVIDYSCFCPRCPIQEKELKLIAMPVTIKRDIFLCLACGLHFRIQ